MSHGSKRARSSRRHSSVAEFNSASMRWTQPILVTATDVCFWLTMFAVAIGFGGRMAGGQLALVVGASVTALCWALYLITTDEPRYSWTGSEWLWFAGILVGISQISPLPTDWLLVISPKIKVILPLWFDKEFSVVSAKGWHQLSLAPWETASGMATFVSYGLLFFVACQRNRTIQDIERSLCHVGLATFAMMTFAQLQFVGSNGKFFWTFEHPFMNTDSYPLGCFTNRNHLAQFLALGTAPTIWWLLRRFQQQHLDRAAHRDMPMVMHLTVVAMLLFSLVGIGLTVLMTLSRGGLMAMALSTMVATGLMCRLGLASMKFLTAIALVAVATGVFFSFSKYESILSSRLEQNSGRSEIWKANLEVAQDFPVLGTGVGTHSDAYQLRFDTKNDKGQEYTHAECGYLQVASETGIAGLIVAALMIATSLWWGLSAMRNSDVKVSSAAAAILGSLIANVSQAVGDFFWYTPSCMLLLAVQLACAARLHRLTRQEKGATLLSVRLPRFVTASAMLGLLLLGFWMLELKTPALMAEPHRMQEIRLASLDERELTVQEKEENLSQRLSEALLAAKLNPRDAKLQESACNAYLQLFEIRQQEAENPMSVGMLRDTVRTSEFPSVKASNEWLERAVGANLKLLRLAKRAASRSIAQGPLRSKAYVQLADLNFLSRKENPKLTESCLKQALALRPSDPETLYLVGNIEMQEGHVETALGYWKTAFERSTRIQERIATVLSGQVPLEYFQTEFHPDWKGLEIIGRAFVKAGREDEAEKVKRLYITEGLQYAQSRTSDDEFEATMLAIRDTSVELGDLSSGIEVLISAIDRIPHSYTVRYRLGLDLMADDRPAEAAEHLQWCSSREPNDKNLRDLTSRAVIERLKQTPATVEKTSEKLPIKR